MAEDEAPKRDGTGKALPRAVQEHLGRRLRTELHVEAEKPSFLGETSVPPQFEPLVRKLEAGEQRQGYEAVKRALNPDAPASDAPMPMSPPPGPIRRPKIPKRD